MKPLVGVLVGVSLLVATGQAQACPPGHGPHGGGPGYYGSWGRHWNPETVETVSGTVKAVERFTPYDGMSEVIQVTLQIKSETISVHLGPAWFVEDLKMGLKPGDKISVLGSRITFSGNPALIAGEVRRGSNAFQFRDEDGYPLWAAWRARS